MHSIGSWRFRRVLGLSSAWVVVSLSFQTWWISHVHIETSILADAQGGGGIGAVSNGYPEFTVMFVIPPMLLLMTAWFWADADSELVIETRTSGGVVVADLHDWCHIAVSRRRLDDLPRRRRSRV
jgi:hypothetical protein